MASQRTLDVIRSEADLEPFRRTDPFMLPSNLHGDARFAWLQHLWRAGMVATYKEWGEGARGVPLASFWMSGGDVRVDGVLHWPYEGHRLIIGAPGSGKFTAAIAPLLLDDDGANAFVIDPKGGEGFRWSGHARSELGEGDAIGARVLDPCALFPGIVSESINPLDRLTVDNPNLVGDADKIVDALVIVSGHEREPVWISSSKKTLRALVVHLATWPSAYRAGATATLMDVQNAVSQGIDDALLAEMAENPVADGLVVRGGLEISDLKIAENTWRGVKFQIDASLAFLDNPGVRRTLAETSFPVVDLRRKRLSLYVAVPNKEKEALGRWLRLVYTTVIDRIDQTPGRNVHVVVDEFAALGKFDRVLTDLATQRAAGLRYHIALQDLNQLHELYGNGWQTIVGNCSVRQFLAVNDNFTAEYVSRALGPTTRFDGWDYQQEYPDSPPTKRARFVGRDLMTPAEVLAMPRDQMIIFADRCARPIQIWKSPFYDQPRWAGAAVDLLAPTDEL
jgi:type IV secretion system protein VirD4